MTTTQAIEAARMTVHKHCTHGTVSVAAAGTDKQTGKVRMCMTVRMPRIPAWFDYTFYVGHDPVDNKHKVDSAARALMQKYDETLLQHPVKSQR